MPYRTAPAHSSETLRPTRLPLVLSDCMGITSCYLNVYYQVCFDDEHRRFIQPSSYYSRQIKV